MTHETASPDAAEGSLLLGDDRTGPKLFQHRRKGTFTSVLATLLLAYALWIVYGALIHLSNGVGAALVAIVMHASCELQSMIRS